MASPKPVQVIAVTSGKGGVGKTNISVNLATAMGLSGKRVLLFDADLGLANVDVVLGLQPKRNLSHVINGECSLEEILLEGPAGIKIVPASSGTKQMAELSAAEHAGVIRAFSELSDDVDVMIVDTAAGIADGVVSFTQAAQHVILVVCDEPASITDAYAMIKVLSREHGVTHFRVLANMAQTAHHGRTLFNKISSVAERFLDVSLEYMGAVPFDEQLRKAVQKQGAVVENAPRSRSAMAFRNLAEEAGRWPLPQGPRGNLEFFVERLLNADARDGGGGQIA
ncbi:flagellar biosynthesis protein FlhG [Natronospira proteinivora]|uniref:Flagellar biosynthesis protein FlhG n=1 Tax=Natronospira proteinivora TaxID=1807133 RepID=A0ABT1G575_9GAMM|nr:MinD/ParA family protein [Natronospira proteinivora]MCP1726452.1 flagellar biosynthesis protein FlhG [Natronospira proteinivora]